MTLNPEQKKRYARHLMLEKIGEAGQEKLLNSSVLLVGLGGLGSPAAMYLTASGIGSIGLVDGDIVELQNLQRQIIHQNKNIGQNKVDSANNTIKQLNPDTKVKAYCKIMNEQDLRPIVKQYDFVLDCCDNFKTKMAINNSCLLGNVSFCHAGILEFQGQIMTIIPNESACYNCIFDPTNTEKFPKLPKGVLGVLPGVIGTIQATEAIKFLLNIGTLLTNQLMIYNALEMNFRKVKLKRNPNCTACGNLGLNK